MPANQPISPTLADTYTYNTLDFDRAHHNQQLYYRWQGEVSWTQAPERPPERLFHIIGMNATRVLLESDSDQGNVGRRINREIGLFCNPDTQNILDVWHPETTPRPVVHIANRIVQGTLQNKTITVPAGQPYLTQTVKFPLTYPHPLASDPQYQDYCPSDTFTGMEIFTSHVVRPGVIAPPAHWNRDCPWLLWMKLGYRHPARLQFETTITRVETFEELDSRLVQLIRERLPIYEFSPSASLEENMTSIRYFKQHFKAYMQGAVFPIPEKS
jgi:hypothetical protein